MTTFDGSGPERADGPLRRHRAALFARPRWSGCAARCRSATRSPSTAPTGSGSSWREEDFVNALGALSGNQAMQMVRAGLKAIYLSGWQVAADANTAGAMYPDQSLYPANSGPELVRKHQPHPAARRPDRDAGGQALGRDLVRADRRRRRGRLRRAAQRLRDHEGVHRGGRRRRAFRGPARLGEEVRPHGRQGADPDRRAHPQPRRRAPRRRRDGRADARRRPHRRGGREAHHLRHRRARPPLRRSPASARRKASTALRNGLEPCIARAIAYAPYADLIWCETSKPDLDAGAALRRGRAPGASRQDARLQLLAVASTGRSTSTRRRSQSSSASSAAMGYKFQFITLAGFHQLNFGMFELARGYRERQMAAYSELQEAEFAAEARRLHRDAPPARGRHRLFRRRVADHHRRPLLDHRDGRIRPRPRSSPTPRSEGGRAAQQKPRDASHEGEMRMIQTKVKERAEALTIGDVGPAAGGDPRARQRAAPAEPGGRALRRIRPLASSCSAPPATTPKAAIGATCWCRSWSSRAKRATRTFGVCYSGRSRLRILPV